MQKNSIEKINKEIVDVQSFVIDTLSQHAINQFDSRDEMVEGHTVKKLSGLSTNELFKMAELPPERRNDFTNCLHRMAGDKLIDCYWLSNPATYIWTLPKLP